MVGSHVKCIFLLGPAKKVRYGVIQSFNEADKTTTVKFYRNDRQGRRFVCTVLSSILRLDSNPNEVEYGGLLEEADDEFLPDILLRTAVDWGLPKEDGVDILSAKHVLVQLSTQTIRKHLKLYVARNHFSKDGTKCDGKAIDPQHVRKELRLDYLLDYFIEKQQGSSPELIRLSTVKKVFIDLLMDYLFFLKEASS